MFSSTGFPFLSNIQIQQVPLLAHNSPEVLPSHTNQPQLSTWTPIKEFTHPQLRAELLLLFLWKCAVPLSIWNYRAGCKSTELLRRFPAMGWSQLSCHNTPGAGQEAVTTLTRQQGWADRQNFQHLMTRDHGALAQYLCRVYSLQIPSGKSVWSELYFQHSTN